MKDNAGFKTGYYTLCYDEQENNKIRHTDMIKLVFSEKNIFLKILSMQTNYNIALQG